MQKLPRSLDADSNSAALIRAALKSDVRALWSSGTFLVPHFPANASLLKALSYARHCRKLCSGLENIEEMLKREEQGFAALKTRGAATPSQRVSRILLMSSDGTERLYRACESLLKRHEERVLGMRLEMTSDEMGNMFFGKERMVKVMMVEHKDFVTHVLKSLVAEPDLGTEQRQF